MVTHAECRVFYIVMPSVIMLSVVMMNIVGRCMEICAVSTLAIIGLHYSSNLPITSPPAVCYFKFMAEIYEIIK
jgi:hypothetical protein